MRPVNTYPGHHVKLFRRSEVVANHLLSIKLIIIHIYIYIDVQSNLPYNNYIDNDQHVNILRMNHLYVIIKCSSTEEQKVSRRKWYLHRGDERTKRKSGEGRK